MIRSTQQLRDALGRGETIVVDTAAPHFHTFTGETIRSTAFDKVREEGGVIVLARDIEGEPMQWGAPDEG